MYQKFSQKTIEDFSESNIESMYNQGFVFTRVAKGAMNQIESVRVRLDSFEPSSENRRILKKFDNMNISRKPLPYGDYSWEIGKLAKSFYKTRFGSEIFSANKIKELFTNPKKSNMNGVLIFTIPEYGTVGYCLTFDTERILHYSYPFYDMDKTSDKSTGMAMMVKSVLWAKENGKKFIYLGSFDKYKLQFKGTQVYHPENGWLER